MSVQHSAMTGADLHEPKGASGAVDTTVYTADGAGSGSWKRPLVVLNCRLADVSTASSVFIASPYAGTIIAAYTVLQGAITGADSIVKLQIAGVDVTGGSMTIANAGSAAGDVDSCTPSAANTVTAGQAIEIETDGASTNTVALEITIVIKPSE